MVSYSHVILKTKQNKEKTPQNKTEPTRPLLLTAWIEFREMQLLFLQSEKLQEKAKSVYFSQGDLLLKPNNEKAVDSTAMCFITDYNLGKGLIFLSCVCAMPNKIEQNSCDSMLY